MKRLSKFFLTLALVVTGMCYSPSSAKADLLGVGDAALLAQQILQYIQDLNIGNNSEQGFKQLYDNIKKGVAGLQNILNVFDANKKGVRTFRNVAELTRKIAHTAEDISDYVEYLGTIGDDFEISRCYNLYRSFRSRTEYIMSDLSSILDTMRSLSTTDGEGTSFLDAIDKAIVNANTLIDCVSDECLSNLADMVRQRKMQDQGETVENMSNLVIV